MCMVMYSIHIVITSVPYAMHLHMYDISGLSFVCCFQTPVENCS